MIGSNVPDELVIGQRRRRRKRRREDEEEEEEPTIRGWAWPTDGGGREGGGDKEIVP